MAKLTLQPKPTFEAKVGIPAAGAGVLPVVFTFKHRTRTELKSFVAGLGDFASDGELIMAMASGWDLADPFTLANVELLVENFVASPTAILDTYLDELARGREKN